MSILAYFARQWLRELDDPIEIERLENARETIRSILDVCGKPMHLKALCVTWVALTRCLSAHDNGSDRLDQDINISQAAPSTSPRNLTQLRMISRPRALFCQELDQTMDLFREIIDTAEHDSEVHEILSDCIMIFELCYDIMSPA